MRRKTEIDHVHAAAKNGFIKPRRSLPSVKQSSKLHGGMKCALGAAGAVLLADQSRKEKEDSGRKRLSQRNTYFLTYFKG